jgi:hypothetical protein
VNEIATTPRVFATNATSSAVRLLSDAYRRNLEFRRGFMTIHRKLIPALRRST